MSFIVYVATSKFLSNRYFINISLNSSSYNFPSLLSSKAMKTSLDYYSSILGNNVYKKSWNSFSSRLLLPSTSISLKILATSTSCTCTACYILLMICYTFSLISNLVLCLSFFVSLRAG